MHSYRAIERNELEEDLAGADCMGEVHCGINSKGAAELFSYRRLGSIVIACIMSKLYTVGIKIASADCTFNQHPFMC